MYCIQCGSPNPDSGVKCLSCGAQLVNPYHGGPFQGGIAPSAGSSSSNPYQATGIPSAEGSHFANPYQAGTAPLMGQRPPNYLPWAIITTVCCGCLPFGIVAIVYAAQVDSKFAAGDYSGAQTASNAAKMWCLISFGLGCLLMIGYIALAVLGAMADNIQ